MGAFLYQISYRLYGIMTIKGKVDDGVILTGTAFKNEFIQGCQP